ncbi:MAG: Flp pilus assembly protein CpaB [Verrucomicrobiota bacterium]
MIIGAVLLAVGALALGWYMLEEQKRQRASELAKMQQQMEAKLAAAQSKGADVQIESVTDTREVVFAQQDIGANNRIERVLLTRKQVPTDLLPNAYTTFAEVEGKFAKRNIKANEPLTPDNLSGEFQKMSHRLTPGMRAVALQVIARGDATGGFATDGDYVDLIAVADIKGTKNPKEQITKTVMQNVRILYMPPAEQSRTEQTQGVRPVSTPDIQVTTTFEVTPMQAEAMVMLSQYANIYMVLRHRDDDVIIRSEGVNTIDMAADPDSIQRRINRSYRQLENVQEEIEQNNNASGTAPSNNNPALPSNETILQP